MSATAARGRMAQALLLAGRPAEAVEALAPIDEWLSPSNLVAREQLESVRDWQVVPETAAYRGMVFGAVLRAAGEPEEALVWLEQTLRLRGAPFVELHRLAEAGAERAMALHALGRRQEAVRAWKRAEADFARLGAGPGLAWARQRWEAACGGGIGKSATPPRMSAVAALVFITLDPVLGARMAADRRVGQGDSDSPGEGGLGLPEHLSNHGPEGLVASEHLQQNRLDRHRREYSTGLECCSHPPGHLLASPGQPRSVELEAPNRLSGAPSLEGGKVRSRRLLYHRVQQDGPASR